MPFWLPKAVSLYCLRPVSPESYPAGPTCGFLPIPEYDLWKTTRVRIGIWPETLDSKENTSFPGKMFPDMAAASLRIQMAI
jgi:hypothetical protein